MGYHTKPLRRETKLRSVYLNCVLGADPRFAGRGLGIADTLRMTKRDGWFVAVEDREGRSARMCLTGSGLHSGADWL